MLGVLPNSAAFQGQTPLIQGTPSSTGPGNPQQGAVLMVYGLNHQVMNCDRLFNLLCQYGNVVRVSYIISVFGNHIFTTSIIKFFRSSFLKARKAVRWCKWVT